MTQPDWDDERLDAAFQARFGRPAPASLPKDIHVRIAGTSPARFGALRVGRAWMLAAAAAVVVVLITGTALVGLGGLGRTGGSPIPPHGASASAPSATPTEQALPGVVLGLMIIHVPDAIASRDAGVDDREIAVAGWFRPAPAVSCQPLISAVSPLQLRCPDTMTWLMRDHEAGPFDPPVGPAFNPDLDGLDASWQPTSGPVDVVFVGHFDDRRAALCPAAEQAACRDRFVVDSVPIVHGSPVVVVLDYQTTATAASTNADVEAIVFNETRQVPLSMAVVDGPSGLTAIEPSLGAGQAGLIDQPVLWVVRVLEAERAVTYLVIDGSDAIFEMNPEGEPILVGGTPPTGQATASAGPWPPSDAKLVELGGEVGAGRPPVRVAVVDQSGRLVSVMEQAPATVSYDGRFGASAEPGMPGRVNLGWIGGVCDSQITVTIGPDLRSIDFDMGPQPPCDSMAVGRQLILYFTGSVDVPAIQVGDVTVVPSTSPSDGPGYELDCGPFGPDTCQAKAAAIVLAAATQQVVSIAFSDECGSYAVTFADGTATASTIDCVLP